MRKKRFPNGYVESWNSTIGSECTDSRHTCKSDHSMTNYKKTKKSSKSEKNESIITNTEPSKKEESDRIDDNKTEFDKNKSSSMTLMLDYDALITNEDDYTLSFNLGMVDGECISTNDEGNQIIFNVAGLYKFEVIGSAFTNANVEKVMLIYDYGKKTNISQFCEILLFQYESNNINLIGTSAVLPVDIDEKIKVRLVPIPDENITILSGARLIVYRV